MHDGIKFCTLHAVRFVGSGRPSSDVFLIIGVKRSYLLPQHDVRGEEATPYRRGT